MAVKKKKLFENRVIGVMPVMRTKGNLRDGHDSQFINEGATHRYCVPISGNTNSLIDPLQDYENPARLLFAKELAIDDAQLNVRAKDCYWKKRQVILSKDGKDLDLNTIDGLVEWLILQTNTELVAPSWDERFDSGTYKYCLVDKEAVDHSNAKKTDVKIEAYEAFGKLRTSKSRMYDFLLINWLDGKSTTKPSKNFTEEQLLTEIGTIVESKPNMFLDMISDEDYDIKVLIQKAVICKSIRRIKGKYGITGSETIGNLQQMIDYLDPKGRNQEDYLKVTQEVEASKND